MLENKGYVVSFLSINDTVGKHAAYLVSYFKDDQLVELNQKYSIFYIFMVN